MSARSRRAPWFRNPPPAIAGYVPTGGWGSWFGPWTAANMPSDPPLVLDLHPAAYTALACDVRACRVSMYSREEDVAFALAIVEHLACERYDRTVCSGLRGDVAVPATPGEYRLSADHARAVMGRTDRIARNHGLLELVRVARKNRVFEGSEASVGRLETWARGLIQEAGVVEPEPARLSPANADRMSGRQR